MHDAKTRPSLIQSVEKPDIFSGPGYRRLKRVVDVLLIILLLPLISVFMLLIAAAVKLASPGPIFYRQPRIGKDGVPFMMLKFRSMRAGNESRVHREHVQRLIRGNLRPADLGAKSLKLQNDPRVTPLGRLLRTLSLDELPQFINVLRGQMSIVGPRPPLPYEYELYEDWHKQRLAVLPGITGLWQVMAHNQVSFDDMVRMDLAYIESMNLWLDLKIIVLTPLEMLRSNGGG
jgi:lipopolysaccharide/colanic/teichoic acid biosynthesis glycosyltransferase